MIEKVNPSHPDKLADRIAGALVDLAYKKSVFSNPRIAVEVLIGHGICHIINETSEQFDLKQIEEIVDRIAGKNIKIDYLEIPQDIFLSGNQNGKIRCGDNGIFKGVPLTAEQKELSNIARKIYSIKPTDGKYILTAEKLIICQSNMKNEELRALFENTRPQVIINPLGYWTGGIDVDSGATNRKLGSDMGDSISGGGLHGKDLSKADVSINIYAFLKAQRENRLIELNCAIGDEFVDNKPFEEIVEIANGYIKSIGGFEKFAEWGLY